LIDAFSSTLEDSVEADILLHVVDASDPKIDEKIQVVDDILQKIGAEQKKIYVFNKTDMIDETKYKDLQHRFQDKTNVFVSTYAKK
jgi:GTPase